MKNILLLGLLFFLGITLQAQTPLNLLPIEGWEEGSGTIGSFEHHGEVNENTRQGVIGPDGSEVLGWRCTSQPGTGNQDGGFKIEFPIDHAQTFRFSAWVRRNSSTTGSTVFRGANNTTLFLDGTPGGNCKFYGGDLPTIGDWYYFVGYIHKSNHTGTENFGGIYDTDGNKILSTDDHKFLSTATDSRMFASFNAGDDLETQDLYAPRVDIINGNEPSIQSLADVDSNIGPGNLLDIEKWKTGTGSIGSFIELGLPTENERILDLGPHAETTTIWRATASGDAGSDGGWRSDFPVDHEKTYRFTVWAKRNDSDEGRTRFGALNGQNGEVLALDNSVNTNPLFFSGDLPELNKWYLLVGYVHGSSYSGDVNYGGVYDGVSGEKVLSTTDFKSSTTATMQRHRAYFNNCTIAGESQDLWGARAEIVNGNEPTIKALIGAEDQGLITGNLIPVENWLPGQGSASGFEHIGLETENDRIFDLNPHNQPSLLWRATASGDGGADGGWNAFFPVDHRKTYRFSVWARRNNSDDGNTYLGANNVNADSSTVDLNNQFEGNPYLWKGDLPELNKWYLIVGYVHGSGYTGTTSFGGVYDGETGEKVLDGTDFKHTVTATRQRHRAYFFFCNTANETQDMWGGRAELADGNEPSIEELLGLGSGPHVWSEITDGAVYNVGSVGIGVDENDMDTAYKLLVDGDIKTRKVKVTLDGWADYVFDKKYNLIPIEELEKFIAQNGHLPDVPTEEQVMADGIYLGDTDALLLRKIEELTLYLIEQNQRIQKLEKENESLKESLNDK